MAQAKRKEREEGEPEVKAGEPKVEAVPNAPVDGMVPFEKPGPLPRNVLIAIEPSAWILIVSGLLALFIALAKRRDDLVRSLGDQHRRSLSGYSQSFLDTAVAVVLGAVLVTYMIYTTDRQVMAELGTDRLVYTVIFLIAGILRYLQITLVENRSGSPTTLVLTDRFLIATGVLWAITLAALIHI